MGLICHPLIPLFLSPLFSPMHWSYYHRERRGQQEMDRRGARLLEPTKAVGKMDKYKFKFRTKFNMTRIKSSKQDSTY